MYKNNTPGLKWTLERGRYLVCLHDNKDVVHADSQHQEGDDLDHDEGEGDTGVAEDPQWAGHGAQHDQDARYTQGDFRVHLHGKKPEDDSAFCHAHFKHNTSNTLWSSRSLDV